MGRCGLKQEDLNYWTAKLKQKLLKNLWKLAQDCFQHSVVLLLYIGSAVIGIHRYGKGLGIFLLLCMFKPVVSVRPVTSYTFGNFPTNEG